MSRGFNNGLKCCYTTFYNRFKRVINMEKEKYSIKELSSILGCSVTAVQKKIKTDLGNVNIKRYKNRYDVVTIDGKMFILLDSNELENEKRLSKGFNNVHTTPEKPVENGTIIDVDPSYNAAEKDELYNFTERYIERFETTFKGFYNDLRERDKQVLLLTTSEKQKEVQYLQTAAENKALKQRNFILFISLIVTTVLIIIITTVLIINIIGVV